MAAVALGVESYPVLRLPSISRLDSLDCLADVGHRNANVEPAAWTARRDPGRSGPRPGTRPRRHHPGRPVPAAGCPATLAAEHLGSTW